MTTEMATREPSALAQRYELEVEDMIAQVHKIQQVMAKVMKEGEHYGVIPGTGTKPTLLKPGAEKLCLLFRLAPHYQSAEAHDGKHVTIKSACSLHHIPTGQVWGTGEGSCSTKESKYAYRKGARLCPKCSKETIVKGKQEYGGGWLCFAKKGGCGAKFKDGDTTIEGQSTERVANDDLADTYNTVLKMANKRSLVAAVLNVTGASDIFTQDLEDTRPDVLDTTARRVDAEQTEAPFGYEAPKNQARGVETAGSVDDVEDSPEKHRAFYAKAITATLKGRGATKAAAKALFKKHLGTEEPGEDFARVDIAALQGLYNAINEAA